MKSAYMICVLLGITIGSLVLADGVQTVSQATTSISLSNFTVKLSSEGKIAATLEPSNFSVKSQNKKNDSTTTPVPTISTTSESTSTTASSIITSSSTTTSAPTTSNSTTTSKTTTVLPPTTSTNATTTVSSTPVPTSTTAVRTTAEPPSTPSPSKDRHFDGLSFFGGIILATCLMAIAAFSWKFYRQCNERNYRTL